MEDYQEIILGERQRIAFSILGFTCSGGLLVWTGVLFNCVVIREERIKSRSLRLNEHDYQMYWSGWKKGFKFKEIL